MVHTTFCRFVGAKSSHVFLNRAGYYTAFVRRVTPLLVLILLAAAKPSELQPAAASAPALTCTLPAPSSLSAVRTGSTTASVEWSAVTGAVSYSLKVYDQNTNALVSSTVVSGTGATVSGLESGRTYRVEMASMCSAGSISEFVIVDDVADV